MRIDCFSIDMQKDTKFGEKRGKTVDNPVANGVGSAFFDRNEDSAWKEKEVTQIRIMNSLNS